MSRAPHTPFRAVAVAAALLAAGCARRAAVDTSWHDEGAFRWRALDVPPGGHTGFTLLDPSRTGITFRNDVDDEHALANRNLINGSGVALGDVDGDGLPDVFLGGMEKPSVLYRNLGNWHFKDVTAESGLDFRGLHVTGAVLADVNGDGALDLLVTTLGGPIKLWLNDGHGKFTDATRAAGLDSGFGATTMTLADVDGSGALALYVATYKVRNALDSLTPQERMFDHVVTKHGGRYEVEPRYRSIYRVENRPEYGAVMRSQRAERDLFYMNDGKGHFTSVPFTGGRFLDEAGKPLKEAPDYFTLAARFYDVNGDGAPDLYVCNDFEDPDQFWINDGHGTFRLAPKLALRSTSNSCMSVDFADVNRDGVVDIFTADMKALDPVRRKMQTPTHSPLPKLVGVMDDRPQWQRNVLQLGRGDGTWAEIGAFAGVDASEWSWGSAFVDVDLDGYEDLLIANGHRWDVMDADTWQKIRDASPSVPWNREMGQFPRLATKNVAFRNNGDLTFTEMGKAWGFGVTDDISHGLALADLDGDGDLDVVVNRLDGTAAVYRNETSAPRIAVRLAGRAPNTEGIGAKVRVLGGPVPVQEREMTAGGLYLSSSDPMLTFAAGKAASLTIEVRWRDGSTSRVADARPNRLYEVREPAAAPAAPAARGAAAHPAAAPSAASVAARSSAPLFEDVSSLIGHSDVDSAFDDYRRQPLLPEQFSLLGPGITWYDLSGTGREDLIVGTGRGGRLAVYRNAGGRFTRAAVGGTTAPLDLTQIAVLPSARGGATILAGQSNYESATPANALRAPSALAFDWHDGAAGAPAVALPPDTASVGPVAVADVDGNGWLDVFVGARIVAGAYPVPAPSRFYRNDHGTLVYDAERSRVFANAGLVSAAVFSDLDGDGWPDLVLAIDWGPIRVYHNDHGHFVEITQQLGLAQLTSRWIGVTTGDLDGDGRPDIIATSWGRNTEFHASADRPLELHYGNFGGTNALDLLFARAARVGGPAMPLETFARLSQAMPAIRQRVPTFAAFARSTLEDVVGPALRSGGTLRATTFDHTVFLNRGTTFEAHPLPAMAQLAPAHGVVVADFDGDGHEDVFLAQNFFPTEVNSPRYDAGVGLLLLGDGAGGFRALSPRESGIEVFGDQRGAAAADFDGDGRLDLAVTQSGAATKLYRNVRAKPGLRVRLVGPPGNPRAIGAQLRVMYGVSRGPAREVHGGSGYWSQDGATQVLAAGDSATGLWVRWPGGAEQTVPLPRGIREVVVRRDGVPHAAGPLSAARPASR